MVGALLMHAALFVLVFALEIAFLLQAFGAVSLSTIALKRIVPWTVRSLRTEGNAPLPGRKTVLWLLNVSYFMDSADLRLGQAQPSYSRHAFLRAVLVVFLLDMAFGVYLCLNPMLLQMMPYQELVAIVTVLSIILPLLLI